MKKIGMAVVGTLCAFAAFGDAERIQALKIAGFDEAKMGIGLGGEFPGARAGLVRTNETTRFSFDFTKGGNYVTMNLGQLQDGARSVSCQCRLDCPSKANFWIRASDAKGDVYLIAKPTLASMGGWQAVTHDLRRLGWCRGKSTNRADRATVKWPISAEILVEPHQRKLKGYVEMKDLVLATTNRVSQKDWAFSCGAARFGQVYLPDEVIAVKANLKSLRTDGADPAMRLEKAVVTDWQNKEVLVKKCSGDITLTADELKGQFGAFRVTFWGTDEKKLGETWFARLTGRSKPVAWAGTGVHGWSTDTRRYELIAKAGLGTVRNDIPGWSGWEKEKGVYQCPRGFRETIDKMHSLGIEMNLILNSLNPLYGKMLDFDAFCNWVRYVVTHEGKDVEYYEIWNEPNNFYFGPKLRNSFFDSFTKFTKQVVKTIREVKPGANIEVVAEDGPWHTTVFLDKGIATPKEILSIHPYIHDKNPRPEHCHFYFRDDGKTIQASMASNGVTRVRMTEIGWTTYAADEHGKTEHWYVGAYPGVHFDQQAYYMIRAYLLARTYGVESMMQYDFQNDGPKRNYTEHNFGMVFQDCTPKPSYAAVAFMTRLLGEAKPLGFVGERDAKVSTVCAFKLKDGRKAYAMWAYQDPVEVEIPSDVRGGFVFDLMGNRSDLGNRAKLTLTESPVYVVEECE